MPTARQDEMFSFAKFIDLSDNGVLVSETIVGDKMFVKRTHDGRLQLSFYDGVFQTTKRISLP